MVRYLWECPLLFKQTSAVSMGTSLIIEAQKSTVSMGMFLETELTQVAIELPTLSLPIAAESPPCRTLNNN
jgi:hypothetical protein